MPEPSSITDAMSLPLGQQRLEPRRRAAPLALGRMLVAVLGLPLLGFAGWVLAVDDPLGGEPIAIVSIKAPPKSSDGGSAAAQAPPAPPAPAAAPQSPPETQTVTVIDGSSGKRQQVTIAVATPQDAPAPDAPPAVDPRLLEPSRHGPIPRIAADGSRPSAVYASRRGAAGPGQPRIAIVVGGLGISAIRAAEALAQLPAPVTFAFSPYGTDLAAWAARARAEGHEVLVQAPMEPLEHPHNDAGPQALLTTLAPDQNIDRLHFAMSRFQGYVGLSNFMGARFLANEQGVTTVLREAARRGLIYFDDGAIARSLAGQIASANHVPFARADLVIDATPAAAAIDAALGQLETIARERGLAIGSASALSLSIERIAQWAKSAADRGIVLTPITAAASRPGSI